MDPLPQSPLGQRLCETFSYRWMCIESNTENASKPEWKTITKYPLKPRNFWNRYQDAAQLVGVRFGRETEYLLLDVDTHSPYLNQLSDLEAALETIGLYEAVRVRSSWSGGIHLYYPLPQPMPTFDLACAIDGALKAQGFEVSPGKLEIFPNVKDFGEYWKGQFTEYLAHRLPLQPGSGSCLLDWGLQPIGGDLERFFQLWDMAAIGQRIDELRDAISTARSNRRRPRRKSTHPVEHWRSDLEERIVEGWTGHGQTNGLLKDIACYGRVFEGLEGTELASYVERIATTRDGYERWCNHHHDISRRCRMWARAAEKYYWPMGTEPQRTQPRYTPNEERAAGAYQRIAQAAAQLRFDTFPTIRARIKRLVEMARTSVDTLYKYAELWHPGRQPVTAHTEGDSAHSEEGNARSPDLSTITEKSTVTGNGGKYEVWNPETPHLKNLSPGRKERGCGGEEGLSTGLGGAYA